MYQLLVKLRHFTRLQRIIKVTFLPLLLLGVVVALLPSSPAPEVHMGDKVMHALAFFGFALLADIAWRQPYWLWKFAPLLAYGILIEVLQGQTSWRSMSMGDVYADAFGLLVYWMLFHADRLLNNPDPGR